MWDQLKNLIFLVLALSQHFFAHAAHIRGLATTERGLGQETQDELDSYRGIIAGETASACDYPWHAKFEGSQLCGGTVVGNGQFVLTAGHCLDDGHTPPSGNL